ncbi:unnamed protein product, partial [Discosporangium mesarthrocarpum]
MHVEVARDKLLAARRLNQVTYDKEHHSCAAISGAPLFPPYLISHLPKLKHSSSLGRTARLMMWSAGVGSSRPVQGTVRYLSCSFEVSQSSGSTPNHSVLPLPPELSSMGALPFEYYEGCIEDFMFFGREALMTDSVASTPEVNILDRGREALLSPWILQRLTVSKKKSVKKAEWGRGDTRATQALNNRAHTHRNPPRTTTVFQVLVTSYQVECIRRDLSAAKIEGLYHMYQARERARELVFQQYEKRRHDLYSNSFYYHSNKTGVDSFLKPKVLRADQDLDEPPDHWIEEIDSTTGRKMYTNPATGQYSRISVEDASAMIVRKCRRFLQLFYVVPTPEGRRNGRRFHLEAKRKWEEGGGRLASTLNYALVLHTHHNDLDAASPLYEEALSLSPENPLVQRTCALFLLASCKFPREASRRKALDLLTAADYRDREMEKFSLAQEAFYHWGLVMNPRHSRALLNWALVLEHVHKDVDRSELFYRRALAANDLDPNVLTNYHDLCLSRLPGGANPGGGPGTKVLLRPEWDGWQKYMDPVMAGRGGIVSLSAFWFHPLRQEISWCGP